VEIGNVCTLAANCSIMAGNWIRMSPVIRIYWVMWLATRHQQTLNLQLSYEPFHTTVSNSLAVTSRSSGCHVCRHTVKVCGGKWHLGTNVTLNIILNVWLSACVCTSVSERTITLKFRNVSISKIVI
jgi:hypothetical protein